MLLVSSEHAFPYDLTKLGFNIADIERLIFAGEVSPAQTYELLTTRWGVGPHLATALIEHCGGHLWDIAVTLRALRRVGGHLKVIVNPESSACVDRCLDAVAGNEEGTARMITTLRTLAERGFCAVDKYEDPLVEHVSRFNVGGLVKQGATICGIDSDAHGYKWEFGLVPSRQSMRLAIAKVLRRRGLLTPRSEQ